MKLSLISLIIVVTGCTTATVPVNQDPGVAAPVAPHDVPSGLCCQLTVWYDSYWGAQRYECSLDSGIEYNSTPWLCGVSPDSSTDIMDCENPQCVVGMPCQGANGYGVVLACNTVIY